MIWAADALKRNGGNGSVFFNRPTKERLEFSQKPGVFEPWALESLYNRFLSVDDETGIKGKKIICNEVRTALMVEDLQKQIENAEDGIVLVRSPILHELHRLAQRQFHWKRGYLNIGQVYRSATIYTFEAAQTAFAAKHGLTIADLCSVGFAAFAATQRHPAFHIDQLPYSQLGVARESAILALQLISVGIGDARKLAKTPKWKADHAAYTWSVLRESPLIFFNKGSAYVAPIPELIMYRISEGLYLDLVRLGDKGLMHAMGRAFEAYCKDIMQTLLPDLKIEGEFSYNRGQNKSADLFVKSGDKIMVAVECKAKKMPLGAKYADHKRIVEEPGIDELSFGVVQLWQYFSYMRRHQGSDVDDSAVGMLLLLDPWTDLSDLVRGEILKKARAKALLDEAEIIAADMRPIVISSVQDLEYVLMKCTGASFLNAVQNAARADFLGWHLASAHDQLPDVPSIEKDYPFLARVAEQAPWWSPSETRLSRAV